MNAKTHPAPWSKWLVGASIIATLICLIASFGIPFFLKGRSGWHAVWPILVLLSAAPFSIFSYTIHEGWIGVRRLLWTTRIPLADLRSAEVLPGAMKGSLRACGNAGLYSITGWYWNRTLGFHRAFVTDSERTVVLDFNKRKIIVSPENPQQFVADLNEHV